MKILVYSLNLFGKPTPSLLMEMPTDGFGKSIIKNYAAKFEIPEADNNLNFKELVEKYPYTGE